MRDTQACIVSIIWTACGATPTVKASIISVISINWIACAKRVISINGVACAMSATKESIMSISLTDCGMTATTKPPSSASAGLPVQVGFQKGQHHEYQPDCLWNAWHSKASIISISWIAGAILARKASIMRISWIACATNQPWQRVDYPQ